MARSVAHPSTAAIAGHPLHPAVVPIPVGAAALAFASDLVAARTGDAFWARGSRWLLRATVGGGLLAAPLGSIDLLTIPAARRLPSAWLHGVGNALVLLLALREVRRRRGPLATAGEVSPRATGLSLAILGVTGWLGGELSYRHRIGVMPDVDGRPEDRAPGRLAGAGMPSGAGDGGGGVGWAAAAVTPNDPAVTTQDGAPALDQPAGDEEPGALDPTAAESIARELARSKDPAEGARDAVDDPRPWGAGRTL